MLSLVLNGDDEQLVSRLVEPLCRLHRSSGCFGSCTKPIPITAVDEPSKGLRIQGQLVRKQSSEFWSTSTCDLDISAFQSQQSISSVSVSNCTPNNGSTTASFTHPSFINHGLILWNQTRFQWIGVGKSTNQTPQSRQPRLSWNPTYDSLLSTRQRFCQPVPLTEIVESLVEIWEQEGLYD